MKNFLLIALLFVICSPARAQYDVVPLPQSVQIQDGEPFVLREEVRIVAQEGLQREAVFLRDYLLETIGKELSIVSKPQKGMRAISLSVSSKMDQKEGYTLTVDKDRISIVGGSAAGVFYGIQTLRKSLAVS